MRVLIWLIGIVVIITVLRMVIGVVTRGAADLLRGDSGGSDAPRRPAGGELKRDPVCGTFVSESASIKKAIGGETWHFCSAACRDKYKG